MNDNSNPKSVADDDIFVTLIQVAREDPEVRERLLAILALDSFNRKSSLNSFIDVMRLQEAPHSFVSALARLLDDEVAEKALALIQRK